MGTGAKYGAVMIKRIFSQNHVCAGKSVPYINILYIVPHDRPLDMIVLQTRNSGDHNVGIELQHQ
jgi:hypothetical protein